MNTKAKVVILAGGLGTRLREETDIKPKPMVSVGGLPILWHLMKFYSNFGLNDFIICTGYKGEVIRDYFKNFHVNTLDFTIDLTSDNPTITYHQEHKEKWKVTVVDTGLETPTGGRINKIKKFIDTDYFYCTYGDGLSNVDILKLTEFHENQKTLASMTVVRPLSRFGVVDKNSKGIVESFREKPQGDGWVNAGFFVFKKEIFTYLNDNSVLEEDPLKNLANVNELSAFEHNGFWQPMDTHREFLLLNEMWEGKNAHWKNWND